MDPTANLSEQLRIASRIVYMYENDKTSEYPFKEESYRLAQLIIDLDQWIKEGGFLPRQWNDKR